MTPAGALGRMREPRVVLVVGVQRIAFEEDPVGIIEPALRRGEVKILADSLSVGLLVASILWT